MITNLEYYKYFYYVAWHGSVSEAARHLCISQPAVSQAIKQLELSLGTKLTTRISAGVKLTPEGETLYEYVKRGIDEIEKGESIINQMINLDVGEIKIGASDMTLKYYLLPFLEKFHEKYKGIKINVTNAPTPLTLKNLKDGIIDFGIVSSPFTCLGNQEAKYVRDIKTAFVAGSEFKKFANKKQPLSILEELPIICLEPNTSTRKFMDEYLNDNNVSITPEFELATSDMIVQFALRNLGIGVVVKDFAKPFLDSGDLYEIKFKEPIPKRHFAIVTDNKRPISHSAKKLLDIINE